MTEDKKMEMQDPNGSKSSEYDAKVRDKTRSGEKTYLLASMSMASLYKAALAISWISILFSLASGVAAIVLSFQHESESLFAYGLDATLDSLSSVAVVWRFSDVTDYNKGKSREYKACIVIGIMFLVSALSLIGRSIVAIVTETREDKEVTLFFEFSLICGVSSLLIGLAKIYVGLKVSSQALYTDSIITLVGAATCFMALVGLEAYMHDKGLWYLDSLFGILCGGFLIIFGLRLLVTTLRDSPKS